MIHYLTHVRRVNIAGVKVILELLETYVQQDQWERLVKGVEQAVESLPADQRRMLEEGRAEVLAELERESSEEDFPPDESL